MAKPTDVPEWATDDDFATGPAPVVGTPTKVDPGALSGQGFVPGTAAAAQIMNWLLNRNGRWAAWLNGLVSSDNGDDVTIARKTLTLFAASRADIIAGSVWSAYARLRGDGDSSHVVASAVEEAVYAALTSWSTDERARLTLRGAIREILGRDVAGANAPVAIPYGLNVGTSFMPPAGYLPGAPTYFTTPGSHTWTAPTGVRAVLFELVGAGGGASKTIEGAIGGGGGEYAVNFFTSFTYPSVAVTVGAGGTSGSTGHTDGGNSQVSFSITTLSAAGGKSDGSPGDSGPGAAYPRFRGQHGSGALGLTSAPSIFCAGGASGAGWAGHGGSLVAWDDGDDPREDGEDGAVKITPFF